MEEGDGGLVRVPLASDCDMSVDALAHEAAHRGDDSDEDESLDDCESTSAGSDNETSLVGSMLEHPVFVYWCSSCGREASKGRRRCARCPGHVERHQRVMELPDDSSPEGSVGLLSLKSLRAALADISVGEDIAHSALLLFEQGPDPGVAAVHPALATQLADLAVPPAVQRALVGRGFVSWEQLTATVSTAPDADSLSTRLGLSSPAAEVLLRRLWHAATAPTTGRQLTSCPHPVPEKRLFSSLPASGGYLSQSDDPVESTKCLRLRNSSEEAMAEELALESWKLRPDGEIEPIEDEGILSD